MSHGTSSEPQPGQGEQPLAYRAVRGGLWLLISSYWSIAFGFVVNILLTRLLTPEVYGEFALAMFFFALFNLRTKLGLNFAYAQQREITGEAVGTLFSLEVGLGLATLLLSAAAAPILIHLGYSRSVVTICVVLSALAFAESFLAVFNATLDKSLRFKPGSIINSVVMPLSYVPAFWLALTGAGHLSLLAQAVAYSLLGIATGIGFIAFRMRDLFALRWRFSSILARRFVQFGAVSGLGNFVSGLTTQVDNFIVGTVVGTTALGYYDRAYRTSQWPGLLVNTSIGRSALFTYTHLQNDPVRLQKTVSMVFWILVSAATPIALALFIAAADLVQWLYGDRWLPAVPLLRVLLVVAVIRPLWENAGAFFVGAGRPKFVVAASTLQLLLLLVLGWPLAHLYAAQGVTFAVSVALFVTLLFTQWLINQKLRLDVLGLFVMPALAAALTAAGYLLLNRLLPVNSLDLWLRVLLKAGYAMIGYWALLALLQPRGTVERLRYIAQLVLARPSA